MSRAAVGGQRVTCVGTEPALHQWLVHRSADQALLQLLLPVSVGEFSGDQEITPVAVGDPDPHAEPLWIAVGKQDNGGEQSLTGVLPLVRNAPTVQLLDDGRRLPWWKTQLDVPAQAPRQHGGTFYASDPCRSETRRRHPTWALALGMTTLRTMLFPLRIVAVVLQRLASALLPATGTEQTPRAAATPPPGPARSTDSPVTGMQQLWCEPGQHTWERSSKPGRKPKVCPAQA